MNYPDTYIASHDIDWFCVVNGVYIHVASAGGMIPNVVNDIEHLRAIQYQVSVLPYICGEDEIVYNEQAIANLVNVDDAGTRTQYIASFKEMARKGFVSIDKTNIEDRIDNRYHTVCRPRNTKHRPEGIEMPTVNTELSIEEWIAKETEFRSELKDE